MFPHDVENRHATADLSLELGIHVVLIGLQPAYAHGLHVWFTATGLRCSIQAPTGQAPTGELTSALTSGSSVVAVLPPDSSPLPRAPDGVRLAAVHVLAEASVQAYSEALRAGATGAFARDAELTDIGRIVLCAGLGLTVLPVDVARALNRSSVGPRPQLSDRELEYLRLLADGATIASLGRRFAHSERETYRLLSAVYAKLGAHNRTEALLLAQRAGLFDEPG